MTTSARRPGPVVSAAAFALIGVLAATAVRPDPLFGNNPLYQELYQEPELSSLAAALVFHQGFERDDHQIDLFDGEPPYANAGSTATFLPGLYGRALTLGSGSIVSPGRNPFNLSTRGSLAFWVNHPKNSRSDGENTFYLGLTCSGANRFQVYGSNRSIDAHWNRPDHVPSERFAYFGGDWVGGRWHFVVVNWDGPAFGISVDGEGFIEPYYASDDPLDLDCGGFTISPVESECDPCACPRLDEMIAFRRPLVLQEVRRLYSLYQDAIQ